MAYICGAHFLLHASFALKIMAAASTMSWAPFSSTLSRVLLQYIGVLGLPSLVIVRQSIYDKVDGNMIHVKSSITDLAPSREVPYIFLHGGTIETVW